MVDYMLWPWFEIILTLSEDGFVLNADGKLPKLDRWIKAMEENEVVQKTKVPNDVRKRFMHTVQQGNADYDVQ